MWGKRLSILAKTHCLPPVVSFSKRYSCVGFQSPCLSTTFVAHQCCLFVSATSAHVPLFFLSATSLFELDLVFDIERALSVFDCDRYYNFMFFGMAHMEMAETEFHRKQFLCVFRMGLNHTCLLCEHGILKLNGPNASVCQTFLANSSPTTTNETQVEFDHRMLCTLGFKNQRQVLTSSRYPPREMPTTAKPTIPKQTKPPRHRQCQTCRAKVSPLVENGSTQLFSHVRCGA